MKKFIILLAVTALSVILLTFNVFADFGPKPRMDIKIQNPPDELYYLDLLIPEDKARLEFETPPYEIDEYDPEMFELLFTYRDDGWLPAYASGTTWAPLSGSLVGSKLPDGSVKHRFSYYGLPDEFKIIIVTESGGIKLIDHLFSPRLLQDSVTIDYTDGSFTQKPLAAAYIFQFLSTCIPTLVIEGALLILFRFKLKENWLPFILVNIATQLIMTAFVGNALIQGGYVNAYLSLPLTELFIFAAEAAAFAFLLKGHSKKRRILYALASNAASLGISILLTIPQFNVISSYF